MSKERRDQPPVATTQDQGPGSAASGTWTWGDAYDRYEVSLGADVLTWLWIGPKDLGGVSDQPIAEFLAFGPLDSNAPATVLAELRKAIERRDSTAWMRLLADAEALRAERARQQQREIDAHLANVERGRKARALPDPWRQYEPKPPTGPDAPAARPTGPPQGPSAPTPSASPSPVPRSMVRPQSTEPPGPLGPLLARGLLIFGVSIAVCLLLATVLPLLANYASLFLPVLLGFVAAFRWGSPALVIAGFFALAGGIGSQLAFDRYAELSRGSTVTLGSIVEAPHHPEATRFIVDDVHSVRALAGSGRRTTTRSGGSGPNTTTWVLHVMPLVARGWTHNDAVPAWIACTTSPGFDCLSARVQGINRMVRVRDDDLDFYRGAVANAEARHHVVSAMGAPVLEISDDPAGAPTFYFASSVAVPLAVYALWAMLVVGWRTWRRGQAKAALLP